MSMFLFALVLVNPFGFASPSLAPNASASLGPNVSVQYRQNQYQNHHAMNQPYRHRRNSRNIGHAYSHAGNSAGRGGKLFGKNISRAKPLKAGKEFGRGMGGFGKGIGKGTGLTGRKAGMTTKRAVTP